MSIEALPCGIGTALLSLALQLLGLSL